MEKNTLEEFIRGIPKAELHLHIEGTFEPELMFEIASRNGVQLKYKSVDELKKAYQFNNLQEFLDIYYEGAEALKTKRDFFDLTWNYLEKIHRDNVVHTEIFFDPQTHTTRGVSFETVLNGINEALVEGKKKFGISNKLIMCFLRHLDEASAFETLECALNYKKLIFGVGLDSSEVGNPPSKFKRVFQRAIDEGFVPVAHAGEEGPAQYIWEAIDLLRVKRIDHGNHCLDDEKLVEVLKNKKIPLTLCPLSNLKLQVISDLSDHPLKEMMDKGLRVTINSDDPAYFGGYINDNYISTAKAINLSKRDISELAKNSFLGSFLSVKEIEDRLEEIERYFLKNQ